MIFFKLCLRLLMVCSLTGLAVAQEKAGRKIVVSGFEPFGGRHVNASAKLAEMIAAKAASPAVTAVTVPVVWGVPGTAVKAHWPGAGGLWIAFGEGTPGMIRVETIARNRRGDTPDNAGQVPNEPWIRMGSATTLEQPFPAEALVDGLEKAGFHAKTSAEAGRYLCEEMLYELLHQRQHAVGEKEPATVLFIHVPPWGSRVDEFRRADEEYFKGLAAVMLAAVQQAEKAGPRPTAAEPAGKP